MYKRQLITSFISSPHLFTALSHTIYFFPIISHAVILTNYSHSSIILATALSLSVPFFVVPMLPNISENCSAFLAISSWKSCCFSFTSSLSILHLYDFLPRRGGTGGSAARVGEGISVDKGARAADTTRVFRLLRVTLGSSAEPGRAVGGLSLIHI